LLVIEGFLCGLRNVAVEVIAAAFEEQGHKVVLGRILCEGKG